MSDEWESAGELDAAGKRVVVVAARFNGAVVDRLVDGARECLSENGVAEADIDVVRVPGAWEIPLALEALGASGRYHAAVALGAVIRGETSHYDVICREAARGIAEISVRRRWPIGFGLLTCENAEQAAERAGGEDGNKGWEAAEAALEMLGVIADTSA